MDQRGLSYSTVRSVSMCLPLLAIVVTVAGCSDSPEAEARRELNRGDALLQQEGTQQGLENATDGDWDRMTETDPNLYQEAMSHYDEAVKLAPDFAEAYYQRGFALLRHDELLKAIEDFSTAIKLNPDYARAYLMRSRAYEGLDDKDKSKADRDKALELQPGID